MRSSRQHLAAYACAVAVGIFVAASASGQDVSARDRQSAAQAYDRGTAAYLREDFDRAAEWFETAHRLAPAAAALVQAVRSHQRAGHGLRAATLALRLRTLYPDDPAAERTAASALAGASQYLRVDVECDECTVEVGDEIMRHTSFFLEAGTEHEVVAEFATGNQTETVQGGAGETVQVAFTAPAASPDPTEPSSPDSSSSAAAADTDAATGGGGGGVPVAVTVIGMVVTAGLGGVLIWSGVDVLDGADAYRANPTREGLDDGLAREERTNWLIGGTAVAGIATLVLALFTDWGGGEADVQALFDIQRDRGLVGLRGRF